MLNFLSTKKVKSSQVKLVGIGIKFEFLPREQTTQRFVGTQYFQICNICNFKSDRP
jgi:hypothetical protein